jgi:hypothetical protein
MESATPEIIGAKPSLLSGGEMMAAHLSHVEDLFGTGGIERLTLLASRAAGSRC